MSERGRPTEAMVVRRAVGLLRGYGWVLLIAVGGALVAWLRFLAPVRVEVARIDRGSISEEAFGRGTVESQRDVAVGFDLVGRLSQVLVEEGTRVTLGQEVARLETEQARADLRSAQTGIAAARSTLHRLAAEEERARSLLSTAERDAARTATLVESGALTPQQRDEASDRVRLARAELDRVVGQRSEATRGIDVAVGGAEQRRVAMVRATLLAPFDGLVTRRVREPGDTVTIGSTVLRVADTSQVHVSAAVDETVLPRLAIDQRATIHFPGTTTPSSGKVTRISWEADRQTHELLVEVTPDRLDRRVAIGQRADVRIELARREHVVRVPVRLLRQDGAGPYLYADRGGRIAVARPRLGVTGGGYVEVVDGLSEGDVILGVARGRASLEAGRRWSAE